jgi:hypothetical protein
MTLITDLSIFEIKARIKKIQSFKYPTFEMLEQLEEYKEYLDKLKLLEPA